jgi:sugar/nucleoside kinase (ribokinase family)
MLQQPGACVYIGCVGQDKYHQLLHDAATKAGLTLSYQVYVDPEGQVHTGTCAVLITGKDRYNTRIKKKDCLLFILFFFFRIDH